jgi:sugar lactone lactonase YvrE
MPATPPFTLDPSSFQSVGTNLHRPECVLATRNGDLYVSDQRGGVTRIAPDGAQHLLGTIEGTPNGLAMDSHGGVLVAEIEHGGVYHIDTAGKTRLLFDRIDDRPLGSANFVYIDAEDRYWLTVSTRTQPRSAAISRPIPDGYLVRFDGEKPRIVLDGLHFANEVRLDRGGHYLYIAESSRGRIIRCRVGADGQLGPPQSFGPDPLFPGAIVDGLAFDADGALWVTEVSRNGMYRLRPPDGDCALLFEDPSAEHLNFPASIAFGGPDLRTAWIGTIRGPQLKSFYSPVAGAPMAHWRSSRE